MTDIINEIIKDVIEIIPIGHHHLKRHQVFEVKTKTESFVVKFYFKKNRFESELKALNLLKDIIPVPKVIQSGLINDIEYLIMGKIEGQTMENVSLSLEEKKPLIEEAGRLLRKINMMAVDLPYGRLQNASHHTSYQDYLDEEVIKILGELKRFEHPEPDVILKGIDRLKENISIKHTTKALCHLDFSERNIMINKENGHYIITAIIDFEQSGINDLARELTLVEDRMLTDDTRSSFYKGYGQTVDIPDVYYLFYGLIICAWSLPVDREFYNIGLDLIKRYI